MATSKKATTTLTDEKVASIRQQINNISQTLDFLTTLPIDDRNTMPMFGDRDLTFINKAYELCRQNTDYRPRDFDVDEMWRNLTVLNKLNNILQPINNLVDRLDDTIRELGIDTYASALWIYQHAKLNGLNVSQLDNMMTGLGKRFADKVTPEMAHHM